MEYNIFSNCFANTKTKDNKGCAVLTEKLCETKRRCPFYKSERKFKFEYTKGAVK